MPSTTGIASMHDVVPALERQLPAAAVRALGLRLRISTGVNIADPQPEHVRDAAAISKVCAALRAAGHPID